MWNCGYFSEAKLNSGDYSSLCASNTEKLRNFATQKQNRTYFVRIALWITKYAVGNFTKLD